MIYKLIRQSNLKYLRAFKLKLINTEFKEYVFQRLSSRHIEFNNYRYRMININSFNEPLSPDLYMIMNHREVRAFIVCATPRMRAVRLFNRTICFVSL